MKEVKQTVQLANGDTFCGFLLQAACSQFCPFANLGKQGGECSNPHTALINRHIEKNNPCVANPPLHFVYRENGQDVTSSLPLMFTERSGTIWQQVKRPKDRL